MVDQVLRHRRPGSPPRTSSVTCRRTWRPHDRLPRRLPPPTTTTSESVRASASLRPRPVVDSCAEQFIDPGPVQSAPLDPAGEHHRSAAHFRAVGQLGDVARPVGRSARRALASGVSAPDRAPAAFARVASSLPLMPVGSPAVLDHRCRSGLAARRHRLGHHGAPPLDAALTAAASPAGPARRSSGRISDRHGATTIPDPATCSTSKTPAPTSGRMHRGGTDRLHFGGYERARTASGCADVDPLERVVSQLGSHRSRPAPGGRRAPDNAGVTDHVVVEHRHRVGPSPWRRWPLIRISTGRVLGPYAMVEGWQVNPITGIR